MGTSCTKNSSNRLKTSPIDASSHLLDQNHSNKAFDYDPDELNFVPDSEQPWSSTVPLHLPKALPTLERSETLPKITPHFDDSNSMSTPARYKCDQCGMVFPSNDALFKHKTRFCIGVKDSGINRQPVYSDDEDVTNQTRRSVPRKVVRHQSSLEKV